MFKKNNKVQNNLIILEVGLNHLGNEEKAKKYLDFFLRSKFKKMTFQINTPKYYKEHPYQLSDTFYEKAIKLANSKNKKIGLAVCDPDSFKKYINFGFHFFKLLSIGIKNDKLISLLKKSKKEIYISLGIANHSLIKRCLNKFRSKSNLRLVYTNLSYDPKDLDLKEIENLKKKFNLKVGYGHHYKNKLPVILSSILDCDFIFIYVKSKIINKFDKNLPDDKHAIDLNDLGKMDLKVSEVNELFKSRKTNRRIKIFD